MVLRVRGGGEGVRHGGGQGTPGHRQACVLVSTSDLHYEVSQFSRDPVSVLYEVWQGSEFTFRLGLGFEFIKDGLLGITTPTSRTETEPFSTAEGEVSRG